MLRYCQKFNQAKLFFNSDLHLYENTNLFQVIILRTSLHLISITFTAKVVLKQFLFSIIQYTPCITITCVLSNNRVKVFDHSIELEKKHVFVYNDIIQSGTNYSRCVCVWFHRFVLWNICWIVFESVFLSTLNLWVIVHTHVEAISAWILYIKHSLISTFLPPKKQESVFRTYKRIHTLCLIYRLLSVITKSIKARLHNFKTNVWERARLDSSKIQ